MKKSCKKNPIIALAQIKYFDENPKNNVAKIKRYIRLAKEKNADIICFPESCVHKNEPMHFKHKLIEEIKEECRKNSIWCIIDEDMKIKGRVYNAAILINRLGKLAGHYKKINLYGDTEGVKAGKKVKVFQTDFGKIGIAICWDIRFPKLFKKMKKKGAEIVFCPAYWAYELRAYGTRKYQEKYRQREMEILNALIRTRAFENLFVVALCNPVVSKREDMASYSVIAAPHKVLAEIKDKEGLIYSEIRLDKVCKVKRAYDSENIN